MKYVVYKSMKDILKKMKFLHLVKTILDRYKACYFSLCKRFKDSDIIFTHININACVCMGVERKRFYHVYHGYKIQVVLNKRRCIRPTLMFSSELFDEMIFKILSQAF